MRYDITNSVRKHHKYTVSNSECLAIYIQDFNNIYVVARVTTLKLVKYSFSSGSSIQLLDITSESLTYKHAHIMSPTQVYYAG